jgi:hypothetical protein
MAAIMISVAGINCENLSCNKRGVHIWAICYRDAETHCHQTAVNLDGVRFCQGVWVDAARAGANDPPKATTSAVKSAMAREQHDLERLYDEL